MNFREKMASFNYSQAMEHATEQDNYNYLCVLCDKWEEIVRKLMESARERSFRLGETFDEEEFLENSSAVAILSGYQNRMRESKKKLAM